MQLQDRTDWPIVSDNIPGPDPVRPWLPDSPGATPLTSRFHGRGTTAAQADLDRFTREKSLAYPAHPVGRYEPIAAGEPAQALDDLPPAPAQAAGYLDVRDLPIDRFRSSPAPEGCAFQSP